MANTPNFTRPSFAEALKAWQKLLSDRQLPAEIIWVFDENLCFEKDPARPNGFKLGFQTTVTPPPPEAERIAYEYFSEFEVRIVFYRIGSYRGKSVCVLLGDEWFEPKGESEGFVRRDNWLISFQPGPGGELEEVPDERWKQRIVRDRPLHDLDFCMSLRAVHEILAHGRVLTAYEHYALKFFHAWRRLLGE